MVPVGALLTMEKRFGRAAPARRRARRCGGGWAQSVGERMAGIASVSAPVYDSGKVVAAVCLSGPIDRMGNIPAADYAKPVMKAAEEIQLAARHLAPLSLHGQAFNLATISSPISDVEHRPPRSAVAAPRREGVVNARTTSCAAAFSPRKSSSMAAELTAPTGLAMPRPAMSGALPCMGSKMPTPVAGLTLPLAASPSVPCKPGADVAEDVAEEVGCDEHVEPFWCADHLVGRRVDVHSLPPPIGIAGCDLVGHVIPQPHRVRQRVRLGHARHQTVRRCRHGTRSRRLARCPAG